MKYLLPYSLCFLFMVFCACKQEKDQGIPFNVETQVDEERLLLGAINREGLRLPTYQAWFDSTYQAYEVQSEILSEIKAGLKGVEIKGFVATWCEDSQREIPALYKILDRVEFDEEKLSMVAVDRTKELPKDLLVGYNIEYVPTLIFLKDQKEIGRIVESPIRSLEEDILSILNE